MPNTVIRIDKDTQIHHNLFNMNGFKMDRYELTIVVSDLIRGWIWTMDDPETIHFNVDKLFVSKNFGQVGSKIQFKWPNGDEVNLVVKKEITEDICRGFTGHVRGIFEEYMESV